MMKIVENIFLKFPKIFSLDFCFINLIWGVFSKRCVLAMNFFQKVEFHRREMRKSLRENE